MAQDRKAYMKTYNAANKEKIALQMKANYQANKEKRIAYSKAYRKANKEKVLAQMRSYKKANKEKISALNKVWYEANKEKIAIYEKERLQTDLLFKLTKSLRVRIKQSLKAQNAAKNHRTSELLGTTIAKAYAYLESLFQPGMSWDNHGEWHIDHIIPCASFDLTKPAEQKKCFHYTNLQPLWAADNLSKGARI